MGDERTLAEWTSLPCLNDALAYAIVHGYPSDLAHAALRERQQADTAGQPDETGAYIEVNERGTPLLYFPDGDHEGGVGCREATVAEWSFWRECGRLREQLDAARQALDLVDAPYPLDVFPERTPEQRDAIFAAMRAVDKHATEWFYAHVARERGRVARAALVEGPQAVREQEA